MSNEPNDWDPISDGLVVIAESLRRFHAQVMPDVSAGTPFKLPEQLAGYPTRRFRNALDEPILKLRDSDHSPCTRIELVTAALYERGYGEFAGMMMRELRQIETELMTWQIAADSNDFRPDGHGVADNFLREAFGKLTDRATELGRLILNTAHIIEKRRQDRQVASISPSQFDQMLREMQKTNVAFELQAVSGGVELIIPDAQPTSGLDGKTVRERQAWLNRVDRMIEALATAESELVPANAEVRGWIANWLEVKRSNPGMSQEEFDRLTLAEAAQVMRRELEARRAAELRAAKDTPSMSVHPTAERTAEWSEPMTKAELARRYFGKDERSRKLKQFLNDAQWKQPAGKRLGQIRLDLLDPAARRRVENH